ncbi:hypothetical protein K438DRAFT_1984036 [Mycena galopus ATCC 62051]|nr:hypothetical protein K438DRAFT_1984036 [Mycena galopus ATCC 62051]
MVRLLSIVAAASLAAVASANHLVTVRNTCASKTITPIFHAGTVTTTMAAIGNGGTTSIVVPEAQLSWRIFGQTGTCGFPDGKYMVVQQDGIPLTLVHSQAADAPFSSAASITRRSDNAISRGWTVSTYVLRLIGVTLYSVPTSTLQVGMTFSFSDSSCSGNNCLTSTCDGNHAFSNPTNGGPSIRQCNTPNVGMTFGYFLMLIMST